MKFIDKLASYRGVYYYKVPSITNGCAGCALKDDPDTGCYEKVQCSNETGDVHSILIDTDKAAVAKYVVARLK